MEPRLIEHVSNEIMDRDPNVRWNDIGNLTCFVFLLKFMSTCFVFVFILCLIPDNYVVVGLENAKKCVMEMVIWPLLRPDLFKGCRSPGRGLLLFGPPVRSSGFCI